ncbi:hypothetical protein DL96DRAFT_1428176, partial [Flagelloscypha sp. PMI_526]
MAGHPPVVLHQIKHENIVPPAVEEQHPHAVRLPAVPDLRFEQTYIKSIQPFVKVQRKPHGKGEDVDIRWGRVSYVTIRDQVLSPFLQGALWALLSAYLGPAFLGAWEGLKGLSPLHRQEGTGAKALRRWTGLLSGGG